MGGLAADNTGAVGMVETWYYKSGDREIGPISSGGLRQKVFAGIVCPDTPVRQGGQNRWIEAKRICGLFDSDAAAKKPLWYYRAGDQEVGPISPGGLRQKAFGGVIQPDTLIREGSQSQWLPAKQFPDLFEPTGFGPSETP